MLSFLWQVILKDGSVITEPTHFKKVQEEDVLGNILYLQLICVEDNIPHIQINLMTGTFTIRGAEFHPYIALINSDIQYRIIFFKRNRAQVINGKTHQWIQNYLLGWQCTLGGKNYQRIIFYNPLTSGIEIKGKR